MAHGRACSIRRMLLFADRVARGTSCGCCVAFCALLPFLHGCVSELLGDSHELLVGNQVFNGQPERQPEGAYYLEWRDDGRRVRLSVGKDASDATARRQRKEAELNALNNGVAVVPDNGDNGHRSIATAVC